VVVNPTKSWKIVESKPSKKLENRELTNIDNKRFTMGLLQYLNSSK